ncbi:MAG: hypothetical protein PF489_02800 [Salinivirgaceae bacterium]|jgi:hypothetical protein|nr:hypothetical protein [Salinivirgaceae bacterium]
MKLLTPILVVFSAFCMMGITTGVAQQCATFHQTNCLSKKADGYNPTPNSISFAMQKGEFQEVVVTFRNGHDYHVCVAADDIFGSKVFMQIMDTETNEVMYENTHEHINTNLEFSSVKTFEAQILLETPAGRTDDTRYNPTGCVGLLIESRITPPTGFTE